MGSIVSFLRFSLSSRSTRLPVTAGLTCYNSTTVRCCSRAKTHPDSAAAKPPAGFQPWSFPDEQPRARRSTPLCAKSRLSLKSAPGHNKPTRRFAPRVVYPDPTFVLTRDVVISGAATSFNGAFPPLFSFRFRTFFLASSFFGVTGGVNGGPGDIFL